MRKEALALVLLGLCGATVATNAADVKVTMNSVSKTMRLYDATSGDEVVTGDPQGSDYTFSVPAGLYRLTCIAADGKTDNGSIEMTVSESDKLQEFSVLTNTVYATNDKNTWRVETGDYSLQVRVSDRDGNIYKVIPGSSVTEGRYTFPAFSGNSYHLSMIPGESRVAEGYATLYKSGTLTANVNISGAIPKGENYTVTVPEDADFTLGMKFSHFVDFTPVEPISTLKEGGVKKLTYFLSHGQIYNYRTSMAGKLTRGGYFTMAADAAKRPVLDFPMSDYEGDPAAINHDVASNNGYETGGIFLNINERGHLALRQGSTFDLHAMRTWEISDNATNNYFIEPDFHYTVVGLDGKPLEGVVEITSAPGSAWAELKAVGPGEAIVLVNYDAIALNYYSGAERKPYMGGEMWGAIWPENTGVFVVSVGEESASAKPNMFINEKYNLDALRLAGKNVDAEHDVFYYLDAEEGARYTFTPEGVAEVSVAYPVIGERSTTYAGFGKEGVTVNEDGSYTLLLRHGRQIIRLTDASGKSVYQVITAKECKREIINVTRPGSAIYQPGDKVKVQYSGLFHPANKIAGVYNMSAYVTYNGVPNGSTLIQGSGQYTFASVAAAQAVTFDIPADHDAAIQPEIVMNDGVIQVNGFGDPIGSHRNIDKVAGRAPNFTAVSHKTYFGMIPDVTIPVSAYGTFSIATHSDVEGVEVTVSFAGTPLTADAEGLYSGTYGTYDVVAVKDGFRCFRRSFTIGDDAEGLQTFYIEMEKSRGAWDGKSTTEPEAEEGVYVITNGNELAWLAAEVNGGAAAVSARLADDIDLGDFEWTPIGNSTSKTFSGTFVGGGHTVKGLYISNDKAQYLGLFGYVKGAADAPAAISGVAVAGHVSGKQYVGGLAGYINGNVSVDRCANHADVSGVSGNIGGITGYVANDATLITNCYNTGSIKGASNCGGIVGGHAVKGVKVENAYSIGDVDCPKNAGACVGSSYTKKGLNNVFAISACDKTDGHTLVDASAIESGEVAYKLGEAFGQEIGEDPYPVFGGMEVKYDPATDKYYNGDFISSVGDIAEEEAYPEVYYNIEGIPSTGPYTGLNIVRMSDGSVRKVIVR